MNTLLNILLLLVGFALLIKGADIFVDASSNIAKRLRVPSIVIGLTIVAFGTSAPEAVISISAAVRGANDMAIANVVGSNLFNLVFVVGICAVIKPVSVVVKDISRDFSVSVIAAIMLIGMMLIFTDAIAHVGSAVLFVFFLAYMFVLVRKALRDRSEADENNTTQKPLPRSIIFALLGLAGIVAGGQLTVSNAVDIAGAFGITERVIGLTILALGTSLPELVTSLVAIKKSENDIAVGALIGSNIFNLLFVLGISGIVSTLLIDIALIFDLVALVVGSLVFLVFARTGNRVSRGEGAALIAIYLGYMVYAVMV